MKNYTKNKLKMYDAVIAICTLHQSDWGLVPALELNFEVFKNDHQQLRATIDAHGMSITGHTKAKFEALSNVLPKAYDFANALVLLAQMNGDFVLLERNKGSKSSIHRIDVASKMARFNSLRQDSETHIAALSNLGLTQVDLDALTSAIEAFRISVIEPRQAVLKRKQLTRKIDVLQLKMDEHLRTKMDRLIQLMERYNSEFTRLYKDARVLPDYKGRSNTVQTIPFNSPSEPDDGSE